MTTETERPTPPSWLLPALIIPLIALVIGAYVGDALAPQLVDKHPLWLIALNARNRNLALTTNLLDTWSYYLVGTLRLLLSDPLFYLLGYFYGDAAVVWMENRSKTVGGMLRTLERWFGKASYPLVLIAPNNPICLFAGAAGMKPRVFITLNVVGTVGRLFLIRWLGDVFSEPIDWLLDFIRDYRLPLTLLSVTAVGVMIWNESRHGGTEVEALLELEEELADTEADAASDPEREDAEEPADED